MNTEVFEIYYEGSALDTGRMDVRELAPSLLALGKLFEYANKELNADEVSIKINVRAGFEKGSFGVVLEISQNLLTQFQNLFEGVKIQDAAVLIGAILGSGGGVGLFQLLRKSEGKSPKKVTLLKDGNVSLEFEGDNNHVVVNNHVFNLYRNVEVRKSAENFIQPVSQDGIDRIKAKIKDEEIEEVSKSDAPSFVAPELTASLIETKEEEALLSIHTIIFGKENKWRFSDGSNTYWVHIEDNKFLKEVDQNQLAFAKGDILKVLLRKSYWQTPDGLRTDYALIKVLKHMEAPKQLKLDLSHEE